MNAITPIESFRGTLTKMTPEFAAALPAQIPVEKFVRTVITVVQMNPSHLDADRRSLLGACMKAAQDGLLLDGREAALVPFNSKGGRALQYMPMIAGILKKIRNSGELASISANVVYKADAFDYELGDEERIKHKPHLGDERGAPVAVYAIARTKDGAVYREVMSVGEVEKIRRASKASNAGPWVDHWGEMARKTVIKRLAKRLPSSADLDQVIASDNEVAGFATQDALAAPVAAPAALPAAEAVATQVRTTSRLKRSIAKAAAVEEPVVQETTQAEEPASPAQEEVTDDATAIPHF